MGEARPARNQERQDVAEEGVQWVLRLRLRAGGVVYLSFIFLYHITFTVSSWDVVTFTRTMPGSCGVAQVMSMTSLTSMTG